MYNYVKVDKHWWRLFMSETAVAVQKNSVIAVFKGVIIAIILSLVAIIMQALALKFMNMNENLIPIVNQVIKGLSILLGCLFSIKGQKNGWLKGLVIGIIYMV
ncbi:MAG: TIGR04086 family membrane protein, partial [Firmicutes bacterium]|nr:TIGR04086 family membrane protein [Bacillota bacterium]